MIFTEKTQYQKFETNSPGKGIARPQFQFPHLCVCDQFLYSHHRSAYSAAGKYVDRSREYINCSMTHGCGNWDWGRIIPFLGTHLWDFRCSVQPSFYPVQALTYSTLQRKSRLCIPFLGIARPQYQIPHSCVCERFIYSQDLSTYFLQQNRQIDRGNI